MSNDALIEAAHRWTTAGQVVLALSGDDGKQPVGSAWQKRTRTNLFFFNHDSVTGIGLLLGRGYVDIDLDGLTADDDLGDLPPTATFGRGGEVRHLLYRYEGEPKKTRKWKDPVTGEMIVEFRCKGAQTMIPPSLHRESGQTVEWMNEAQPALVDLDDLEERVDRLFRRVMERRGHKKKPAAAPKAPAKTAKSDANREQKYVGGAIDKAAEAVRNAGVGSRNDTLNREALAIGRLVIGRPEESTARNTLRNAAVSAGLGESEIDATITSAWTAAENQPPRKIPEPTRRETTQASHTQDTTMGDSNDWRCEILTTKNGQPLKIVANAITVLTNAPEWEGVLGYDEMRETIVKLSAPPWHAYDAAPTDEPGEFSEADTTRLCAWLSRAYGIHVSPATSMEAAHVVAQRRRVHPVRDFLESLRWDGVVRLPSMLAMYAGSPDDDYTRAVSTKMLIAAVARVYDPGCKVDTIPVLEGEQGTGKSTLVRALAMKPEWFFDSDLAIGDKDASQALRGKWIVELGEMSALGRAERGALKAFVTRQIDTYRPSFGRISRDFARRWIAIGTTNDDRYLRDATGNRRWLPVRTGKIDVAALKRDVPQLWAEARVRYEQKEPWHVDTAAFAKLAAEQQEERYAADPWEQAIGAWLEPQRGKFAKDGVTTTVVLGGALNIDPGRWTRGDEMRVAEILTRLGWSKGPQKRVGGARVRPYMPPIHKVVTQDVTEVEAPKTSAIQAKSQPSQLSQPVYAHTMQNASNGAVSAQGVNAVLPSMQTGSDGGDVVTGRGPEAAE